MKVGKITGDMLARIVSKLDDESDSREFEEMLTRLHIDAAGVTHVSDQRAARLYAIVTGQMIPGIGFAPRIKVKPEDKEFYTAIVTAWIDGLTAGVSAERERVKQR